MREINEIGKEVVTFHFCLRWVHQVMMTFDLNMERRFLTLTWKSESLVATILKSSMNTI